MSATKTGVLFARLLKIMKLWGYPQVIIWGHDIGAPYFLVTPCGMSNKKFCTWMYLCCDRMDAMEQWTRRLKAESQIKKGYASKVISKVKE